MEPTEEDEPEREVPARTPPPAKRPLAEFLAEFEQRLTETPDEPATDAHLELEARAEGARHRPGAQAPAVASPPVEAMLAPAESPPAETETSTPEPDASTAQETPKRRLRGRRHRRRRH